MSDKLQFVVKSLAEFGVSMRQTKQLVTVALLVNKTTN
jgi:hypothetical protein